MDDPNSSFSRLSPYSRPHSHRTVRPFSHNFLVSVSLLARFLFQLLVKYFFFFSRGVCIVFDLAPFLSPLLLLVFRDGKFSLLLDIEMTTTIFPPASLSQDVFFTQAGTSPRLIGPGLKDDNGPLIAPDPGPTPFSSSPDKDFCMSSPPETTSGLTSGLLANFRLSESPSG